VKIACIYGYIFLKLHQKLLCQKPFLRKNFRFSFILIVFSTVLLKTMASITFLPPLYTNLIHFPIEQDIFEENQRSLTAPNVDDGHKNKKNEKIKNTHHCKINKFISSLII